VIKGIVIGFILGHGDFSGLCFPLFLYWDGALFKTKLTDTRLWQVSQLLAHANEIPDSVKKALVPDLAPASTPSLPSAAGPVH
jgi:hypothetical protein